MAKRIVRRVPGKQVRRSSSSRHSAATAAVAAAPMTKATTDTQRARRLSWAQLLRRVWSLDVLDCPRCHGRMRLLAVIIDEQVAQKILAHAAAGLGVPQPVPRPAVAA